MALPALRRLVCRVGTGNERGGSGARLSETKAMVKVETGRERLNVTCRIYRMELGVMRMVRERKERCIPALERGVHNMRTKSHDIKLPPSTTIHQTREQELQNLSAECIWTPPATRNYVII